MVQKQIQSHALLKFFEIHVNFVSIFHVFQKMPKSLNIPMLLFSAQFLQNHSSVTTIRNNSVPYQSFTAKYGTIPYYKRPALHDTEYEEMENN